MKLFCWQIIIDLLWHPSPVVVHLLWFALGVHYRLNANIHTTGRKSWYAQQRIERRWRSRGGLKRMPLSTTFDVPINFDCENMWTICACLTRVLGLNGIPVSQSVLPWGLDNKDASAEPRNSDWRFVVGRNWTGTKILLGGILTHFTENKLVRDGMSEDKGEERG